MRRAIDAIASHQPASRTYQVMTAVAYYAGLRPSEVVMLRAQALHLAPKGWGSIDVTEADIAFDEPGEPKTGPRSVPIPRDPVDLLRCWVEDHGFAGDDLFWAWICWTVGVRGAARARRQPESLPASPLTSRRRDHRNSRSTPRTRR
jgi:hypothetical protein